MFCPECGTSNGDEAKFCSSCGGKMPAVAVVEAVVEVPVEEVSIPVEEIVVDPHLPSTAVPKITKQPMTPQQKKLLIFGGGGAAALLVILLILASIPGLMVPLSAAQMPAYAKAFSEAQQVEQGKAICTQLADVLPTSTEAGTLQKRTAALNTVKTFTNRQAKNFVNGADWAIASNEASALDSALNAITEPAITAAAAKSGVMGINASNAKAAADAWKVSFRDKALETCGLSQAYTKAAAAASAFDASMSEVQTLADSAPWYPEGYSQYDSTFATKWIQNAGDDCWGCSYWTLDVVTSTNCSNGVYAELNILKNGTVVDWTNDTLSSLSVGQVGRMQFETYDEGSHTGQLTTLTCNQ